MNIEPTNAGKLAAFAEGMNRNAPTAVSISPKTMPNL